MRAQVLRQPLDESRILVLVDRGRGAGHLHLGRRLVRCRDFVRARLARRRPADPEPMLHSCYGSQDLYLPASEGQGAASAPVLASLSPSILWNPCTHAPERDIPRRRWKCLNVVTCVAQAQQLLHFPDSGEDCLLPCRQGHLPQFSISLQLSLHPCLTHAASTPKTRSYL